MGSARMGCSCSPSGRSSLRLPHSQSYAQELKAPTRPKPHRPTITLRINFSRVDASTSRTSRACGPSRLERCSRRAGAGLAGIQSSCTKTITSTRVKHPQSRQALTQMNLLSSWRKASCAGKPKLAPHRPRLALRSRGQSLDQIWSHSSSEAT